MAANQISTESIGPDQASALLAGNLSNRDLSQSFVNKYAADMESGKWASNASMIRIDTNGHLQDGQHRLAAIKQSGTTQDFVVVKDCPVEDFKKLDLGRGRSARDALTVLGYKKPKVLSGGIRLHYLYKSGRLLNPLFLLSLMTIKMGLETEQLNYQNLRQLSMQSIMPRNIRWFHHWLKGHHQFKRDLELSQLQSS